MGLFKRRKDRRAIDPEERSPELGLKYKDLFVLDELSKQGADLDSPRHVLHFLSFPVQEHAQAASADASEQGWRVEVRQLHTEHSVGWSLVCEKDALVLTPDVVRHSTDWFEHLAAQHDGDYDGWEASLDA